MATRIVPEKRRQFDKMSEDRYDNYGSISRLFRIEIDKDLLADLCESPRLDPIGNEEFDRGYAGMRSYLDAVDDFDRAKSDLAIQFAWVFLGYGESPDAEEEEGNDRVMNAAYPYESIYTTGRKTLAGGLDGEVTREYRARGFHPTKYRIVSDDHVACEFEFLQYLVGQEISEVHEGDSSRVPELRSVELTFIENHLLKWFDKFIQAIGGRAQESFYYSLALMAKGWLVEDHTFLEGARHE